MHIELLGRGDRLGANITSFIAQIIYAFHHKIFILYNRNYIEHGDNVRFVPYNQNYNNSIFIQTLFDFIDYHNSILESNGEIFGEKIHMFSIHYFEIISKVLLDIKIDFFTYWKTNIHPFVFKTFITKSIENKYNNIIPFDPRKTILIHLRLDDVKNYPDYDGYHCADHFRKNINNDILIDNNTHHHIKNIYPHCNTQAPLPKWKIDNQIKIALEKYPNYEIVLLTNPGENTSEYSYRCIQNDDESLDLFLLSICEVVILSKSTFSLSSFFFSVAKEVYVPLWGHIVCFGLFTKYDNTKFTYFS